MAKQNTKQFSISSVVIFLFIAIGLIAFASENLSDLLNFARELLFFFVILIPLLFIIFIAFIFIYNMVKHRVPFLELVKAIPDILMFFFSRKTRALTKESERINAILNNQCDHLTFMEEVVIFLRSDLPPNLRLLCQWNLVFSYHADGDVNKAIEELGHLHEHIKANQRTWSIVSMVKDYHVYDQLVMYHLLNNDPANVNYYARLRDVALNEERDKNLDECFPYSQGYQAFVEGRYEDALAYYQKRESINNKKKNVIQPPLSKVESSYYLSLVYEKLGMREEEKEALLIVAKYGNTFKKAELARKRLAEMGVSPWELENSTTDESVHSDDSTPQPKPINIGPYLLMLIIALGLWLFIRL